MPSYDRAFSTGLSGFYGSVISGNGIRVSSGGLSWSHAKRLDIPVLLIQHCAKRLEAICASKAELLQRLTLLFQRLTLSRNYLKPLRGVLRKQILKTTLITSLPGPLGLR